MIPIEEILQHLPHRYPILLVDRLLEVEPDFSKGKGIKNVTINEPFFQGHYPGKPIMPGVLIVEAIAQCAAAIMLMDPKNKGKLPILGGLENVKFKRMVVPGDQLVLDIQILWMRGTIGKGAGVALVEGEQAASAELIFKLIPKES